jgi:hypothetical protein
MMEIEDKDKETKKLAQILSSLQIIYEQKKNIWSNCSLKLLN